MNQGFDRRQFIQGSLAGMAASTIAIASGAANARTLLPGTWSPPSDRERRRLISTAEFGRKRGVSGRNGITICTHPLVSAAAIDMLKAGGNIRNSALRADEEQKEVSWRLIGAR